VTGLRAVVSFKDHRTTCTLRAEGWAALAKTPSHLAIPVYASIDSVHDYVVQAKGAFDEPFWVS
jgi:hypothetical protein